MVLLSYKDHPASMTQLMDPVFKCDKFKDTTLGCDGQLVKVNKMLLAAFSPYFRQIFQEVECEKPVVILQGVRAVDMNNVIAYITQGEVVMAEQDVTCFLETAKLLKIDVCRNLASFSDGAFGFAVSPITTYTADTQTNASKSVQRRENRSSVMKRKKCENIFTPIKVNNFSIMKPTQSTAFKVMTLQNKKYEKRKIKNECISPCTIEYEEPEMIKNQVKKAASENIRIPYTSSMASSKKILLDSACNIACSSGSTSFGDGHRVKGIVDHRVKETDDHRVQETDDHKVQDSVLTSDVQLMDESIIAEDLFLNRAIKHEEIDLDDEIVFARNTTTLRQAGRLPCPVCGIRFSERNNLMVHIRTQHSYAKKQPTKAISYK